jgi:hypothetical protein
MNINTDGRPLWPRRRRLLLYLLAAVALGLPAGYVALAYKFVPSAWRWVERRHPALDTVGQRAVTAAGIPGDPLNLAFVGSQEDLVRALLAAGWTPADPVTLRSALRIAVDSVAHRSYPQAPVSPLFVNGRVQDLAFELPAHGDPSQRHHVRFWATGPHDALDRALWIGAATFDIGVGLSHTTGQITHHIAPDVDVERDRLVQDLQSGGGLELSWIEDFQAQRNGRNGGGDRFFTDGRLAVLEGNAPAAP